MDELVEHLREMLPNLVGDWVSRNSNYENDLCSALEMQPRQCRYWDAEWNGYRLEFKKGRSIWLDLVRYSEIFTKCSEEACQEVYSLFFIPDLGRERIKEVICVETECILSKLALSDDRCQALLSLNDAVPRSLNAQASLTVVG